MVYPLKAKSEVFMCFKHFVAMAENVLGCKKWAPSVLIEGGSTRQKNLMHIWLNVE